MKGILKSFGVSCVFLLLYVTFSVVCVMLFTDIVVASVVADILIACVCLWFYLKNKSSQINISIFSQQGFLYKGAMIIGITFVIWLISQITATSIYHMFGDTSLDAYNTVVDGNIYGYMLLSIFIAPLSEELLFRSVIYNKFKCVASFISASIVSSVVFALFHGTAIHMYACIVCGVMFALIYEYTGCLRWSVFSHMVYNFLSMFCSGISLPEFVFDFWFLVVSNLALFGVFIYMCIRITCLKQNANLSCLNVLEIDTKESNDICKICDEVQDSV